VPIKPGTDGVLALGIAHAIIAAQLRPASAAGRAGALIDGWSDGLARYTPQEVERITGVAAARIERIARQFAEGAAVAIIGGAPLAHSNGLFNAVAVNALNALVGSVGQPGGLFFTPQLDVAAAVKASGPAVRAAAPLDKLAAAILDGSSKTEVLIVDGANPVFTSPKAWRVRDALGKVPYIASFSPFLDETSILADLILPDHSFLESWSESLPESGSMAAVASAAPATMRPLWDTRATGDVLLDIGRRLRKPLNLPWQTFDEMVAASFMALPAPSADTDAWTDAQAKGFWSGTLPAGFTTAAGRTEGAAAPVAMTEPQFDGDVQQFPMYFQPYPSSAFLDGSLAHLPWLQEMPDPLTSAMWSSWVEINPSTAEKMAIAQGDVVEVASSQGTVRAAAVITPGIAPDLVAMPVGQGHRTFTRYASNRGASPIDLLAPVAESGTGGLAWAATRVKISRVGPPDGRLVMFAGGDREELEEGR
jgi:anaerobic selenocysteine-containing dehydrogenase